MLVAGQLVTCRIWLALQRGLQVCSVRSSKLTSTSNPGSTTPSEPLSSLSTMTEIHGCIPPPRPALPPCFATAIRPSMPEPPWYRPCRIPRVPRLGNPSPTRTRALHRLGFSLTRQIAKTVSEWNKVFGFWIPCLRSPLAARDQMTPRTDDQTRRNFDSSLTHLEPCQREIKTLRSHFVMAPEQWSCPPTSLVAAPSFSASPNSRARRLVFHQLQLVNLEFSTQIILGKRYEKTSLCRDVSRTGDHAN
jgi:hypothetical protein